MNNELKESLKAVAGDILKTAYNANEKKIKKRLSDAQFRKVRKLANDPELFIQDVVAKRKNQVRKYLPIKHDGKFNYTIVSAVYNVEKYLDEYFDSIINQSLNFKKHIHIILVDDGSTDNSAAIIKKWQKKYPSNIHYYHKENGGQASARNLGLQYVKTDWVTFIDPDDFVDVDYFKNTDEIIASNKDLKMVVANIKFYIESLKIVRDGHPLNYRFKQKDLAFEALDLGNNINLSAAASFFDAKVIAQYQLQFDERVKPNFEDGKLIADYLMYIPKHQVMFAPKVEYLYRKREDSSSTIDTSWSKIEKFGAVLEYGFIPMLQSYQSRFGYVPKHIQRTALYDVAWYVRYLMNKPEKTVFLTDEQKQNFQNCLEKIFEYIDENEVLNFNLAGMWFLYKVGMLGAFKKQNPASQIGYIENVDREKKQILITFFSNLDVPYSVQLDSQDVIPIHSKDTEHTFNERLFVCEKRLWVPFDDVNARLTLFIDGKPARISVKSKQHHKGILVKDILNAYQYSPKYKSDGSWLLMDRDVQADDNAEHLYRYIQHNHPEQVCYFALNRDSHDWDRLADDGFNLVAYGTLDFETKLNHCSKIISSHLDRYINNYYGDEYEYSKKFVFLQHGITKDNQSDWFNMKKNLQCLITATVPEYHSIADNHNGYRLTDKEVVLTGFPRHDSLLKNDRPDIKSVVIMPTWRRSILGEVVGDGNTRELNSQFMQTDYAKHWYGVLHSSKLKALSEQYGYQVIFAPHANIAPYLPEFNIPNYIEIWDSKTSNESMQSLFQRSKLMITDYSSVAFELAYLGKTVLYYQFDKDNLYAGGHIYQQGYFDYEQHGFGAVVYQEDDLLAALEQVLQNNGEPIEPYATRIRETFLFRDGKCCERVYQAIKALDEPSDNLVDTVLLTQMLDNAYEHQAWDLVVSRAKLLLEYEPDNEQAQSLLVQGLTHTKEWQQAGDVLEQYQFDNTIEGAGELAFLTAFANKDWQGTVDAYQHIMPNFDLDYKQLQALEKLGEHKQAVKFINKLQQQELSEAQQTALSLRLLDLDAAYKPMLDLSEQVALMQDDELAELKPQLLLAKAHRMLGAYDDAHAQLTAFEKHTLGDIDCRREIAKLAFVRENYAKCVDQFDKLIGAGYVLNDSEHDRYLQAVYLAQDFAKYEQLFAESDVTLHDDEAKIAYIKSLVNQQKWQEALTAADELSVSVQPELAYELTLARYRLGGVEEVYRPDIRLSTQDSYEYWQLISEIAFLMDDRELEKYCYRGMISIYPNKDKQANMEKLAALR